MGKTAVVYWSGTGNTESMATSIAEGIKASGAEVDVFSVSDFSAEKIGEYDKIAFGCPSMGDEVLEEAEFEPLFTSVEGSLKGKKIALFGSYGWGDGQWMRDWQDRVTATGASLFDDGLIINGSPDASGTSQCVDYGTQFGKF